ncbi:MAG: 3-hydroxyacyl-CoA dehydrogenase NAD-binding domain-containing protein [Syntrophotaleaceae bacterium]
MKGNIGQFVRSRELEMGPLSSPEKRAEESPWANWRLAWDENRVAWISFDRPENKINLLSEEALREFGGLLETVQRQTPAGLVLRSEKPAGFCHGADINEFSSLGEDAQIIDKLNKAHAIANRLAELPCPTVAVLHGFCLGGGLELALCCDYRIAVPGARLGLPEVLLGLHPGLGATARLPRLIDPVQAMTLMLTGKMIPAKEAYQQGLVDAVVEERHVAEAVRVFTRGQRRGREPGIKNRLLASRPARRLEGRLMRAKSAKKAPPEHYPAPEALISLWEESGGDLATMLEAEIASFARLLSDPTARNLIRVFLLREKMKKLTDSEQRPLRQVHVIGAGAMGGDIAAWCAYKGIRVSLYDRQPMTIAQAVKKTADLCHSKKLPEKETREVLDRLIPDLRNRGVLKADLVIEAVPEKIDIKQQVYQEIEPLLKEGAILASNTSAIPLEQLREFLADPSRFVGLHFFNPVSRMQLVEVVLHDQLGQEALGKARTFIGQIDRLPAPVNSSPGFLVNRILTPYLLEAMILMDEGVPAETIDQAALDFGFPVGPVELADRVGLDVCLSVAELLRNHLGETLVPVPEWLRDMVAAGEMGRKADHGFYNWKQGKPQKDNRFPAPERDMLDRLLLPMLNAAMACLSAEIVDDADLLDGAMIFGTGFPPFLGGPIHYARSRGFKDIAETLEVMAANYGERYKPDPGWTERD